MIMCSFLRRKDKAIECSLFVFMIKFTQFSEKLVFREKSLPLQQRKKG